MSVINGSCMDVLPRLEAERFQCCVTSPPYYGLRDYGHPEQLGLEATPEEYVARMVEVFREVRRVLRPDGTLWLNIGDSYAVRWGSLRTTGGAGIRNAPRERGGAVPRGFKEKDLFGIPWMLAFALRADGWWLRADIVWSKPNPVPESVRDRPTRSHEYVFLLSKSKRYFYDADAVSEVAQVGSRGSRFDEGKTRKRGVSEKERVETGRRNARSVWSIVPRPFRGAHSAVMPLPLAERCIRAGSRPGDEVIDPFIGSGTVGVAAEILGRRWLGVELNADYAAIASARVAANVR